MALPAWPGPSIGSSGLQLSMPKSIGKAILCDQVPLDLLARQCQIEVQGDDSELACLDKVVSKYRVEMPLSGMEAPLCIFPKCGRGPSSSTNLLSLVPSWMLKSAEEVAFAK